MIDGHLLRPDGQKLSNPWITFPDGTDSEEHACDCLILQQDLPFNLAEWRSLIHAVWAVKRLPAPSIAKGQTSDCLFWWNEALLMWQSHKSLVPVWQLNCPKSAAAWLKNTIYPSRIQFRCKQHQYHPYSWSAWWYLVSKSADFPLQVRQLIMKLPIMSVELGIEGPHSMHGEPEFIHAKWKFRDKWAVCEYSIISPLLAALLFPQDNRQIKNRGPVSSGSHERID